jgi:hypothetical protein
MGMPRKIQVSFDEVFPFGVFAVSEVTPVRDFDRSTKDAPVQARDEESGLLMWAVDALDADPEARKAQRQVTVKVLAKVQPVLPENKTGLPFTPVEFEGLLATPYIDENGSRPRLAWSFRAMGVGPAKGVGPRAGQEGKAA